MLHEGMSYKDALAASVAMLDAVRIPDARSRVRAYPHEFSGGMRQRVMIAMALLCKPDLVIADEPTTALDVTVQAQIIELLKELGRELNTAVIMITHDLGIIAGLCDRVLVLYGGQVMETGTARDIFYAPTHPYSRGLLASVPRLDEIGRAELATIPGNPPDLMHLPPGCPFYDRCEHRIDVCRHRRPPLEAHGEGRLRACHVELDA
jgi:oligopeptide transport system ATP-binding protein